MKSLYALSLALALVALPTKTSARDDEKEADRIENAGHVVRKEGWAKTFYEQQRAKKKGHHACVRAAAFKLMRIYFRCWKDNKCYDANLYEEALKKHGSGLASQLKKTDPTNGE